MIRRLLLKVVRRRRLEQELKAELAFHQEMAAAGNNSSPFGNRALIFEQALDVWRFNHAENLWRDFVYALRTLRKSPGFVATALLSLSLGIGLNTAIFSLAVEFLLSQPSVRDAKSLVYVRQGGNSHVLPQTIEDLRRSGLFEDVVGEHDETFINFDNGAETKQIFAAQATQNLFSVLGIPVQLGRGWRQSDPKEVVVLHPHFWHTRLHGDPRIVGKAIRLDGGLYTVLGVLPDDYRSLTGYGFSPDVLMPAYLDGTILAAYARLKPGMTIGQVNAAMAALGHHLHREFPARYDLQQPLNASPVGGIARLQLDRQALTIGVFFLILLVGVGLVLLVACANVAGLLLARASVRRQEIAIRLALGASRLRLLQQLMMESFVLSVVGAALAFFFALTAAKGAAAISLPVPVPIRLHIEMNWRIVSYAALLAIASSIACGLAPALLSLRESLSQRMQRERKLRLRRAMVIGQIALSSIVLTTAALFLQNLLRTKSINPGFDVHHTVRAEVFLPPHRYTDGHTINPYVNRALQGLLTIPGIDGAAAARIVPFTDATNFGVTLVFHDSGEKKHAAFNWNAVTPDYFRVMEIPLLRGRTFGGQDQGASKVVVVNEEFVQRYLPRREPLGQTFIWTDEKTPYRIVGVVKATKNMTMGENPRAQLYEPLAQIVNDRPRIQFVVRSVIPPAAELKAVQQMLRRTEPASGIEVETMFRAIGFAFLPSQVGAFLMGSIGALGLLLVMIGLYGLLAYSVAHRRREIGIRVAIGASPRNVSALVLREFTLMLVAGVVIGVVISLFVTRPIGLFLVPGLSSSDPASFAVAVVVLVMTAALAVLGPVRRALSLDPIRCLRYE
ncbi:MAG TPA: ABC transporter permease [Bryobacteraceae bacterium]|nr:ABC transporter permease [Bryobacteraceae bacterium]